MKKTIKLFSAILFAGIVGLTSCSKDATALLGEDTTMTLTDSLGKNVISNRDGMANLTIAIKLGTGATMKTAKMERKVGTGATEVMFNNDKMDTVTDFTTTSTMTDVISGNLVIGDKVTYTATITDSKLKTITSSLVYTIVRGNAVLVSNEIELGAQSNSTIEYKFLGLADNFNTYTAGATGTARKTPGKIDFVYYYGNSDKNAFASPTVAYGAGQIWDAEITSWVVKNSTKFKVTSLTATDFDNIKTSKVDDTFYGIDFTGGTTDKFANIAANNIIAFQASNGTVGLIKFTSVALANDGAMKVQIICQK
ncbi:MAG: hypothetical protein ACOYMA_02705 [Bacteroidia bacterium]